MANIWEKTHIIHFIAYCDGSERHKYLIPWLPTGRSIQSINSLISPLYRNFPDSLLSLKQGLLKPSESPAPPGRLQVLEQILCQTPPGDPNVRNRFSIEPPDISRIPKCLKTDSLLNLVIPSRTTPCQKQIPAENHRTSQGFPSII